MQPELSNYSDLIEKQLKPKARKDLIEKLSEFNIIPNSMIDISDGLASDLIHLSVQWIGELLFDELFHCYSDSKF